MSLNNILIMLRLIRRNMEGNMLNKHYDNWLDIELDTEVSDVIKDEKGCWHHLKDTVYYHESGGQHSDLAYIDDNRILGSRIIDDKLYCLLDKELGGSVHVKVDRADRIIRSQIHSAQHVMCSYINKHYDARTVAFFNDDKEAGAEMAFKEINDEIIKDIENVVNNAIIEDLKVEIFYPDPEEVKGLVRDEKLEHDKLRAVRIGNIDFDMCGCIHVPSLRYLQMFKIERYEKTTRGYKIFFLVGEQFKNTYNMQYEVLKKASTKLASPVYEIDTAIDKLNAELKESVNKYNVLNNEYLSLLANKYIEKDEENLIEVFDNFDNKNLSKLVSIITNSSKKTVFFINILDNRMHLIISHHKDIDIKANELFKQLASKYNLKGGGNPFMAQGGGNKDLSIVENIKELIK